jgi:hypothetical protein
MCFSLKERAKIGHWGDFVIFFGFQQHFFSTSIKNVDHLSQWIGQKTYATTYLPLIHLSLFKYPSNLHDFLFSPFEIYKKWPQLTKKPLPFLVEQKGSRRKLRIWELWKGGLKKLSVNFTNIFCAAFSYKSFAWSYLVLTF